MLVCNRCNFGPKTKMGCEKRDGKDVLYKL